MPSDPPLDENEADALLDWHELGKRATPEQLEACLRGGDLRA